MTKNQEVECELISNYSLQDDKRFIHADDIEEVHVTSDDWDTY